MFCIILHMEDQAKIYDTSLRSAKLLLLNDLSLLKNLVNGSSLWKNRAIKAKSLKCMHSPAHGRACWRKSLCLSIDAAHVHPWSEHRARYGANRACGIERTARRVQRAASSVEQTARGVYWVPCGIKRTLYWNDLFTLYLNSSCALLHSEQHLNKSSKDSDSDCH